MSEDFAEADYSLHGRYLGPSQDVFLFSLCMWGRKLFEGNRAGKNGEGSSPLVAFSMEELPAQNPAEIA
jgi:hypothetical protein